jgi:hypothetical protein
MPKQIERVGGDIAGREVSGGKITKGGDATEKKIDKIGKGN